MHEQDRKALLIGAAATGALIGLSAIGRSRRYSFRGKVVLITGGSRGLGLVMAREAGREGAHVAICARDPGELRRAAIDLERCGARVSTHTCDVTARAQVEGMVRDVERRYGGIDVLINNAGTISVGPVETMRLEDYDAAMRVHFWGPLHTILAALPGMKRRGGGRIVNISSIGGRVSVPHLVPYCASKFALVGLSRGLRAELSQDGVVVTTVCPGLMRTGSPRNANFKGKHREEYAWFSIADANPLLSMSAGRAARQVLDASRRGDAEVVLTTQAKLAVKLDALFPEWSAGVLALASRLLPDAAGGDARTYKGYESESAITRSPLTWLNDAAARRNNEMADSRLP